MEELTRPFTLYVSDRIAGRFTTKSDAEAEEERLCRLALRDGHAITTRIVWTPQTHEEAQEAAFHERLP